MALTFSTLRKPANSQVVDASTGQMREEWQLYFDQLTKRLNAAVGELSASFGDVTGPASAVDDNLASFDGTDGKTIQDSGLAASALASWAALVPGDLATQDTVNDDDWSGADLSAANGGTGRSSHTEYAVICGGTTTTAAQQSIASVGTAGQLLTSNGAGALPTFQDAAGGGDVVLLGSGTVSAAATLDIALTGFSAYRAFKILANSFRPATDGARLWLRTSTDGGSSFSAGASDYAYGTYYDIPELDQGAEGDQTLSQIVMTEDVGNVAAEACQVEIMIYDPFNAAVHTKARFESMCRRTNGGFAMTRGAGQRNAAEDVDAVRLMFSAGNITSGTWALYGYA